MIRIAIVDEHPVHRHGLRSILAGANDISVVAAVSDVSQLRGAGGGRVDLVICDPYPRGSRSALSMVRELSSDAAVLVVSGSDERADVLAALQAGARGYLTRHANDVAYVTAIRAIIGGAVFVDYPVTPDTRWGTGGPLPAPALSAREREALAHVARGFTHQQTARRMGVSKATVDTYIGRVRVKLRPGQQGRARAGRAPIHGRIHVIQSARNRPPPTPESEK